MKTNVIYIFSNTGAFITTALYCVYLHNKNKTWGEYKQQKVEGPRVSFNLLMALITGTLWYCQFFFYGLGHVRMGKYMFSSWAIHMIMLVLLSTLTGLVLKEWNGVRKKTTLILILALMILVGAVIVIGYGNKLGEGA